MVKDSPTHEAMRQAATGKFNNDISVAAIYTALLEISGKIDKLIIEVRDLGKVDKR